MSRTMPDILEEICASKHDHVLTCKALRGQNDVEAAARRASAPRGFAKALKFAVADGQYGLIAEIKKASPSRGLIRADFAPPALARAYAVGGATCLSVLTDVKYFQGRDEDLVQARTAVDLPVLRKDFMVDPYQVFEARALGADCILLIMAALGNDQAAELESVAVELGMDVLIEVHDAGEMTRALTLESELIGINNRNLRTLDINLETTPDLARMVPKDHVIVSESGLYTPDDLKRMAEVGAHCFLIGESLMRQADVEAATRALLGAHHG